MAAPASAAASTRSESVGHAQFHIGLHDIDDNHDNDNRRDGDSQKIWRRLYIHEWRQSDSFRQRRRFWHHLFTHNGRRRISVRVDHTQLVRSARRNNDRPDHRYRFHHQLAIGLLAVGCSLPAVAQDGGTTAIANPIATSSGSVSNQAVQINQGGYSQQSFQTGHTCNSATLVFTPFYLGNDVNPEPYVRNQNFGAQISLSVPLNREMVRLCKDLAKRRIEKERLDMALVRVLKCADLYKKGYKIRSDSPYAHLCADVVPVAAVVPSSQPASPSTSGLSAQQP